MMPTKPVYFAVLVYLQLITIQVTLCQTVPSAASPTSLEIKCEYYDKSKCESTDIQSCTTVETCLSDEKPGHCFVLWREDATGNVSVAMKGCFTENQICNQTECVDTNSPNNKKNAIKFCCCSGSMCNRQHKWVPMTTEFPEAEVPVVAPQSDHTLILLLIIISIVTTAVCICTAGLIYKNRRSSFNQIPTTDTEPTSAMGTELEPLSIKLLEVKARGRFGTVWKAQMLPEEVAVKIFPIQDKQSWSTEQDIFMLPKMNHQNILKFIGASKKEENGELSLWLVTSYHPNGSLCDYLKSHTVTWPEMCKIAESMAKGLMHLHEEIINKNDGTKPSIAHRDFKSKNVLLKDDLTACIADFGLALVFKPGVPCGDTHGQVGTRRYMAPEILEGAINFTRDAFLRIDVYACGLVLWELVSRCTAHGGIVSDYTLPFEVELGPHPSLEEMQENVVAKKLRPKIQDHWRTHTGLSSICDTMEECWDHDAEARLSSSCVVERISQHIKYSGSTQLLIETNSPRFKEANNII